MEVWKLKQEIKMLLEENQKLQTQLDVYESLNNQPKEMDEKWQYQHLFMTMAQGVVYQDTTGAILSANPSALNILGISLKNIYGKKSEDDSWQAIDESGNTIPGQLHPAMLALATGKRVGPSTMGIYNPIQNDYVWITVTAIPLFRKGEKTPYQVYTSFEDITERKRLFTQFQLLFNEMLDGFVLYEALTDDQQVPFDFRFIEVNVAFERITGLRADQIIGRTLLELFPNIDPVWIQYYSKSSVQGKPIHFRQYTQPLDKTLEVKAFTPEPGKLAVMFSDITQHIELENKLCEEKTRAEAAHRAKTQFLANMNHELRTPLNGLMGMHQLLQLTTLDKEQTGYVKDAISCCQSLTQIVDEILTYSKLEKNPDDLTETSFQPSILLKEVVKLHLPAARSKGITLKYSTGIGLPPFIHGDRHKIKQILILLIGNAVKFTLEGEVQVSISVLKKFEDGAIELKFSVTDTGIGIPSDMVDVIFDRFRQVDNSHTRKFGGLGLGLTTAQVLAQRLNGYLTVDSVENTGSSFNFISTLQSRSIEAVG